MATDSFTVSVLAMPNSCAARVLVQLSMIPDLVYNVASPNVPTLMSVRFCFHEMETSKFFAVAADSIASSLMFARYAKSWLVDAKVARALFHVSTAWSVRLVRAEFHHG